MTDYQLDLFAGFYTIGPAAPRRATAEITGEAEFVQVEPGVWAVCVYGFIPKLGSEHLHFPHYFGGPAEHPRWRVARHRELPGGTFLFDSREEAEQIVALVFPGATDLHPHMGWIEIPSDDHRRRRPAAATRPEGNN